MLLARALIGLEDDDDGSTIPSTVKGSQTLMNQHDSLPKPSLAIVAAVLLSTTSVGCSNTDRSALRENTNTTLRIDSGKVLDLSRQLVLHITIFTYDEADFRGWPADPSQQEYVRYLQDGGVRVGFLRHPESGIFAAMVEAHRVKEVVALDKAARAAGIEKPSMVPERATH